MFEIIDKAHIILPVSMLVMTRLAGMFMTFPVFSATFINNRFKITLIVMFTLLISPAFYTSYPEITSLAALAIFAIKELMVGFTIGFGTRVIFESFNIAGSFIGRQIGLSMSQVIDPNTNQRTPIISQILSLMVLTYFVVSNGHYLLIETFYNNFKIIPLGLATFPAALGRNIVRTGSDAYILALKFAGPTVVFMLLMESAVAITVRVMPQMNAFFITLPLRIGCGIFALISSMNIFQLMYSNFYEYIYQYISSTVNQMGGI